MTFSSRFLACLTGALVTMVLSPLATEAQEVSPPFGPGSRSKESASPSKKPVSLSYESILKCYPKLSDERMSFRVDLRVLSERIKSVMAIQHSRLIEREVQYRDGDGVVRRLRLTDFRHVKDAPEYRVQADTIADNGEVSPWLEAPVKATLSSPWELRAILARADVLRDETLLRETMLGSRVLLTRKDMNRVLELTLSGFAGEEKLHCEDRKDLGAVCTCSKR